MKYNLLMFLAPETTISLNQAQASTPKPPATHRPVPGLLSKRIENLKLIISVVGNTFGIGLLLASCWLGIHMMQVLIPLLAPTT